jgi:hypothetical protein
MFLSLLADARAILKENFQNASESIWDLLLDVDLRDSTSERNQTMRLAHAWLVTTARCDAMIAHVASADLHRRGLLLF